MLIVFFMLLGSACIAQKKGFTKKEEANYKTVHALFKHFENKSYDTTQRDLVFTRFIYFDHILADTSKSRISKRISFFDELFSNMVNYVDSVGMHNLEAAPTRHFKSNESFFKPFAKGGELKELLPLTLTYFDKRKPNEPIGVLLFEPKTHKLLAWIIINQGGYRYFLTFNLV